VKKILVFLFSCFLLKEDMYVAPSMNKSFKITSIRLFQADRLWFYGTSCLLTGESHEQSVKIYVLCDFKPENALIFTIFKTFFFHKGLHRDILFLVSWILLPYSELTKLKCKAIKSELVNHFP